jgi:hypothetical protein
MKRRILIGTASATMLLAALAASPSSPVDTSPPLPGTVATAQAAVTKSRGAGGGGGGNINGAGARLGELLSGWAVPVLTVIAGCLLVGALASRNIGASVGIVVITLIGLIFLLSPQSIESLAEGIANFVF